MPTEAEKEEARRIAQMEQQAERARRTLERARARREQQAHEHDTTPVAIVDIHMPFMSMVTFMVKWAIASIPAIIILMLIFALVSFILGSIFGTLFEPPPRLR